MQVFTDEGYSTKLFYKFRLIIKHKGSNKYEIEFPEENDTLGNILNEKLNEMESKVNLVSYVKPHAMIIGIKFFIEINSKYDIRQILRDALELIIQDSNTFQKDFENLQ